ncbi:sugar ABC transporter ATP-binding protein [Aquabacterium sp. OR-4]|uniref:sugar ABC transporter ATP-binding protein n=1 Tax=Aquabacterium sp. OR-4 TaxID=2978127 RepID=UPI0021B2FDFB|nr:sugar ABC transporter ATP-binding protein [Aquabacterium sp. OR-4]MDT7836033.1 sugar ABC transporter ATP-binding protein [Aquabacterium sp. OR-4]
MNSDLVLEARGLSRAFTGVQALQGVDLCLRAGEVHALMGQNGAGKSTLIKLLTGVLVPDAGVLRLAGQAVSPRHPADAQRLGISTVYQEVNLCPNLSVAENIFAGRAPRHGAAGLWCIRRRRMRADARALLARLNLADIDVDQPLDSFPVAVQQMVAIARALAVQARVLILDEPTSSLDEGEVARLFALLRRLRSEGLAILFVTHFLDQVYALCDRITVLRNGRWVGEYTPAALPAAALIRAMVGRDLATQAQRAAVAGAGGPAGPEPAPAPLLAAHGLGRRGTLQPVSLQLRAGEVLGVAGLLGSGRTELARLLFGLDRADSGTLAVRGQPLRLEQPLQAIRAGLALCPEERKLEGIVGELSVRENIILALQARQGLARHVPLARQAELAQQFVAALGIKTADIETPVALLSGGNQQKVVLARWLLTEPALLMLDEPTRGIDVAAKQDVMNEVLRLAQAGMAVLFISSELDEVLRLADRTLVLRNRALVGELPAGSSEQAVVDVIAAA